MTIPRGKRVMKEKQLWISSEPNCQKTTFVLALEKFFKTYWMPFEDFDDFYSDDMYDMAVFDEFKGQRTLQWMNLWLQGSPMVVRFKGGQYFKMLNIPTIILSNFEPDQAYHNLPPLSIKALLSRLLVVRVGQGDLLKLMKVMGCADVTDPTSLTSVSAEECLTSEKCDDKGKGPSEKRYNEEVFPHYSAEVTDVQSLSPVI